jgi:hypothetical protein
MTTRHPEPTGAAMIAAKAVMDSLLERVCDVASLAVLSRYPALPCRPMSRDIFVRDSLEDAQTVADIPDGWMPSPLPFGRDVDVPQIGGAGQA